MSHWGLRYKGTEPLTPTDWNTVVDALDELNRRSPDKIACGIAAFSGDGTATEFKVEHGLEDVPTCVICGKGASGLPDIDYWTADGTYITVVFKAAPPSGTNNVKIWYLAIIKK
ncbi:MAG: hypothetical protein QW512_00315 [Thermofilaceae archaeon]